MHSKYILRCQTIFIRSSHTDIRSHRLFNLKENSEKCKDSGIRRNSKTNNYYDFLLFNQDSSKYNTSRSSISNIEKKQESPSSFQTSQNIHNNKDNAISDYGSSNKNSDPKINMNVKDLSKSSSIFENIIHNSSASQKQENDAIVTTDKRRISGMGLDGDYQRVIEEVLDKKIEFTDGFENSYDVKHKQGFVTQRSGFNIPAIATRNQRTTVEVLKQKKTQSLMSLIQFSGIDDKDIVNKYEQIEDRKYEHVFQIFNNFENRIKTFLGKEYSLGSSNIIHKLIECLNNFSFKFVRNHKSETSFTSEQLIIIGKDTYDMNLSRFIIKYLGSTKTSRVYDFKNPSYYKLLDLSLINGVNFNYEPGSSTNKNSQKIVDKNSTFDYNYVDLFNSMCSQNQTLVTRFILVHNLGNISTNSKTHIENFEELQNFISGLKGSNVAEANPMFKKIKHIFNTINNENQDIFKERANKIMRNIRKHKILTYRKIINPLKLRKNRFKRVDIEIENHGILFLKNVVILKQLRKHQTKQLPISYTKIFKFLNRINDREVLNTLKNIKGQENLISNIEELCTSGQILPLKRSIENDKNQTPSQNIDCKQTEYDNLKLKLRFKFYKTRRFYLYKYLRNYLNLCMLNYNNFFFLMIGLIKIKYGDKKVQKFIENKILKGADGILMLSDRKLLK